MRSNTGILLSFLTKRINQLVYFQELRHGALGSNAPAFGTAPNVLLLRRYLLESMEMEPHRKGGSQCLNLRGNQDHAIPSSAIHR